MINLTMRILQYTFVSKVIKDAQDITGLLYIIK